VPHSQTLSQRERERERTRKRVSWWRLLSGGDVENKQFVKCARCDFWEEDRRECGRVWGISVCVLCCGGRGWTPGSLTY
jgi:hypothetical protein